MGSAPLGPTYYFNYSTRDLSGNMLHVIDIQSGNILQRVRFKLRGAAFLTLFLPRETAVTQKRPYHASRQM